MLVLLTVEAQLSLHKRYIESPRSTGNWRPTTNPPEAEVRNCNGVTVICVPDVSFMIQ